MRPSRTFEIVLTLCLTAHLLQSQNFNADSQLNLGIAWFERAKYEYAIEYLQRAVRLDPTNVTAHLYLGRSYDSSYVENAECVAGPCADNDQLLVLATQQFNKVLEMDPSNTKALKALAWRCHRSSKRNEARGYYRKTIEIDPNDFEALYNLAVLDWEQSYALRMEKRAELNLGRDQPLIDLPSCRAIRLDNLARVEEGIALLDKATAIVDSNDAKQLLSILHRERADIQCGDQAMHDEDTKTANEWARRACETKHDPTAARLSRTFQPHPPPPPPPGQSGYCPH